jgi:hypothetical protein
MQYVFNAKAQIRTNYAKTLRVGGKDAKWNCRNDFLPRISRMTRIRKDGLPIREIREIRGLTSSFASLRLCAFALNSSRLGKRLRFSWCQRSATLSSEGFA